MLIPPEPPALILPPTAAGTLLGPDGAPLTGGDGTAGDGGGGGGGGGDGGDPDCSGPRDEEEIARHLREDEIVRASDFEDPTTLSEPMWLHFEDGSKAIAKDSTLHGAAGVAEVHAEAAAYDVDRALDLNFVPVTVLRYIDGDLFSVQEYVPGCLDKGAVDLLPKELLQRAAAFDDLLGQEDRLDKNWMVRHGHEHPLVLIDHSLCLNPPNPLLANIEHPDIVTQSKFMLLAGAHGGPDYEILELLKDPERFALAVRSMTDAQASWFTYRLANLSAAA